MFYAFLLFQLDEERKRLRSAPNMITMMETKQGYDGNNEVELAATKIQSLQRKKSARKRVKAKREGRAATKIQNRQRLKVAKKRVQKKTGNSCRGEDPVYATQEISKKKC